MPSPWLQAAAAFSGVGDGAANRMQSLIRLKMMQQQQDQEQLLRLKQMQMEADYKAAYLNEMRRAHNANIGADEALAGERNVKTAQDHFEMVLSNRIGELYGKMQEGEQASPETSAPYYVASPTTATASGRQIPPALLQNIAILSALRGKPEDIPNYLHKEMLYRGVAQHPSHQDLIARIATGTRSAIPVGPGYRLENMGEFSPQVPFKPGSDSNELSPRDILRALSGMGAMNLSPEVVGPFTQALTNSPAFRKLTQPAAQPVKRRVPVLDPNGEEGTVEEGDTLPPGWKFM
jgi:hypothetical protein